MNFEGNANNLEVLEAWVEEILADPLTKASSAIDHFSHVDGYIDARVFLKNSYGYSDWSDGQVAYETWEASGVGYGNSIDAYKKEIEYDRPVYERFSLDGDVLDVGGGSGTVREFLPSTARHISLDPFPRAAIDIPKQKIEAYRCLSEHLNYICGVAEFLPFTAMSFDWVHMRSMLDHVQVPDLALIEANRVLRADGRLLIGLTVEGGKTGVRSFKSFMKDSVKFVLGSIGIDKWKDHHTWHPSFENLKKLITSNGFFIDDIYWQPYWNDEVVYILARKSSANG